MNRILTFTLLALTAAMLTSCAAPNFQKRYDAAVAAAETPHDTIEGPWEGTWLSDYNQHTGELKAIVSKEENGQYKFLYWATWAKMKGTFKFKGNAEKDGSTFRISGSKRLGPFKYNHNANMTPTTFEATYGSDQKDFGTFELSRPE